MKKTATVTLSKYNVPIKAREKVTTAQAAATGRFSTHTHTEQASDGRVIVSRSASDKDVVGVAREVIIKHNDVIKRLAKR